MGGGGKGVRGWGLGGAGKNYAFDTRIIGLIGASIANVCEHANLFFGCVGCLIVVG